MPKKTAATETVAASPVRAAKPKTPRTTAAAVETAPKPRVSGVKHSKAAAPAVTSAVGSADQIAQIAKIAYGYWEARGYEHGFAEQDWLRAERDYLFKA